jgi:dUTP pyrophosphatase
MKLFYNLLSPKARAPQRMSEHASGFDLFADLSEALILKPQDRIAVPTGIAVQIPPGYEGQVRPRSGLALKLGLGIVNSPGTIDADYRGEIKVILINLSREDIAIEPGMRIAQLIFAPVWIPELVVADSLEETVRQSGGFGHTGHK